MFYSWVVIRRPWRHTLAYHFPETVLSSSCDFRSSLGWIYNCDSLLQSYIRSFPCSVSSILVTLCRTYVFRQGVPPWPRRVTDGLFVHVALFSWISVSIRLTTPCVLDSHWDRINTLILVFLLWWIGPGSEGRLIFTEESVQFTGWPVRRYISSWPPVLWEISRPLFRRVYRIPYLSLQTPYQIKWKLQVSRGLVPSYLILLSQVAVERRPFDFYTYFMHHI